MAAPRDHNLEMYANSLQNINKNDSIRIFRLSDKFIEEYKTKEVPWGPLGYFVFKRTYARRRSEFDPEATGTEEWWECCRRVIEWMFMTQKRHVVANGLLWNDSKAQRTAKEAYDRLFHLKWTPPGRGLWQAGSKFVDERTSAGLFNCSTISTADISQKNGYIFGWMMDALMLGIGVGFTTEGAGKITLHNPKRSDDVYVIEDSREGWVKSVIMLLDAYFRGIPCPKFDYSEIRGAGEPIKGFGGTSSGAGPLIQLHEDLHNLYKNRKGQKITSSDIVDTENLIGKCVVSGNVRRSAAIALGLPDDKEFISLKNDQEKLNNHRWGSNNSVNVPVGFDYTELAKQSQVNGEPGYIWLENAKKFGRIKDGVTYEDSQVVGVNPCSEIFLNSSELCNIAETFPARHDDFADFKRTLKVAYLYTKTVTLTKTHWPETNQVMLKNRRIGLSQSGIIQAFQKHGRRQMFEWCDKGYEYVQKLDKIYSDWFCIPRSLKTSTVKPSGTVSLLCGATPGIHYPEAEYYIRRVRVADRHELVTLMREAGYKVDPCNYSPNTSVIEFPIHEENFTKGKKEATLWEQMENAAKYQYYWADNGVSITVTFQDHEKEDIATALELYEDRLKAVSFLKYAETGYVQAPYEPITKEQYEEMYSKLKVKPTELRLNDYAGTTAGVGEKFCDGDKCTI